MEKPEFGISLDDLELVTGIRLGHLQMMMDGNAMPSPFHAKLLRKHLSNEEFAWMTRHSKPDLNVVSTRAGFVPDGYVLIPYLPAAELVPGDMIAHRDTALGPGRSHWVRVDSVSEEGSIVIDVGSVYVHISKSTAVRVARKESTRHDDQDDPGVHQGQRTA